MLSIDSESQSVIHFHPIPFVVTGISLFLMTLGLSREDLLFETATFGPIVMFNLGVCLQTYSIVNHHQLGIQLDSILFSRFQIKSNEEKLAGLILTCSIVIIGTLFAGFSIAALTNSSATQFTLLLFVTAISYGIVLGRISYWIRNLGTAQPEHEKSYSLLNEEEKKLGRADLELYLLGYAHACKSPNSHRKIIATQRAKLTEEMNRLIVSDLRLKSLFKEILTGNEDSLLEVDMEVVFNELNAGQDQWFRETIDCWKSSDHSRPRENLEALVLLPSLSNLAKLICTICTQKYDENNVIMFDKLLVKLGSLAVNLRSSDLFLSSPTSSEVVMFEPAILHRAFILEMASILYNPANDELSWSPWWIIDLRYRMQLLQSQQDWEQMGPLVNNKDDKIKYYLYGFVSLLVSGGDLNSDQRQIETDVCEAIRNHPDAYAREHNTPKPKVFRNLRSLVTPSSNPVDDVLKMAWILWLTLKFPGKEKV